MTNTDDTKIGLGLEIRAYKTEIGSKADWQYLNKIMKRRQAGQLSNYRILLKGRWHIANIVVGIDNLEAFSKTWEGAPAYAESQRAMVGEEVCNQLMERAFEQNTPEDVITANNGLLVASKCEDEEQARRVYTQLVNDTLNDFEGLFAAFGCGDEWTVAAVCDNQRAYEIAKRQLLGEIGNVGYLLTAAEKDALRESRNEIGKQGVPVSYERKPGERSARLVKRHAPSRRQPCPCGSTKQYRRCCETK